MKARVGRDAVDGTRPRGTGQRAHHAVGIDRADAIVVGVGDDHPPARVYGDADRAIESRPERRAGAAPRPRPPRAHGPGAGAWGAGRSRAPASPSPASVDTSPRDVMRLIALLPVSATYSVPLASIARPDGELNCAASPSPSAKPG